MSFRDWYHPDRDNPDGRSGMQAGMEAGVQIGSMFGPVGAAIGGFAGAALGFGSGRGARRRARRRATRQSYEFAGDVYGYRVQSELDITNQYETELSYLNARVGASGASSDMSVLRGELIEERDQQFAELSAEVAEFRQGESYEWFMDHRGPEGAAAGTASAHRKQVKEKILGLLKRIS